MGVVNEIAPQESYSYVLCLLYPFGLCLEHSIRMLISWRTMRSNNTMGLGLMLGRRTAGMGKTIRLLGLSNLSCLFLATAATSVHSLVSLSKTE